MKFAPGQIVNLKSGGQPMTVVAVDEETVEAVHDRPALTERRSARRLWMSDSCALWNSCARVNNTPVDHAKHLRFVEQPSKLAH